MRIPFWNRASKFRARSKGAPSAPLESSKSKYYLTDNQFVSMLSDRESAVKMKSGLAEDAVSNWEARWKARRREQLGVYRLVRRRDVS
jgi:hypothetical protein